VIHNYSINVWLFVFFIYICFQAHAIGIRGDEQGLGVEINRIVLQTLTFTSGTLELAPAFRGSILLSDSRHGNYLINKARSLIFTTTLPPLIFLYTLNPSSRVSPFCM
jgi:8-amino-7-oxononanoate synthase